MKLKHYLSKFSQARVLVIGDVMLDKYIWGAVSRISPEAPVPIVKVNKENYVPGGAGNAANNIASLGGTVHLIGIVGNDLANKELLSLLVNNKINVDHIIVDGQRPTIQKVRVIGQNQQLLRFDYEDKAYVSQEDEQKILAHVATLIDDIDVIIISDYAKGVITKTLMDQIVALAHTKQKKIVVDPKPKHMVFYKGVTVITPNHKEASEMIGLEQHPDEDVHKLGGELLKELGSNILITRGEKGMALFCKDGSTQSIPTKAKEVYDVSGAGDTVIATLALALAVGADLEEAAVLANFAAGITVGKIGTSTVTIEELEEALANE